MDATIKKEAPQEPQSITPDRHHTTLQSAIKRAICIMALWGLISPQAATAILRKTGLSDE